MNGTKVVVVGLGYVGLPLALRAVEVGYDVVGYDVSRDKTNRLAAAQSYVEDISNDELQSALDSGRFRPSSDLTDCKAFDVAVIAVPTPLRDSSPDLAFVTAAGEEIGSIIEPGCCVILESTTYPGTTEDLLVPILEERSGLTAGIDFAVGFSPERIDPGNLVWTFSKTPKIVSGIDDASRTRIAAFYATLVDQVVPVRGTREAEMAKLLENTFRHVNIALVNELAAYAYGLGIDIWEVIDAASTKPFGFMAFRPGPGVGGHCLPIDPSYLSWQVRRQLGHSFRFVELANDINEHMPDYVVRRISATLNERRHAVKGSKLLLLGLAYKKNSGDARESPARRVAELLDTMGADLRIADPLVDPSLPAPGRRVQLTVDELTDADLVVVLSDHDEFDWAMISDHSAKIFDTRRRLQGNNVEHL